MFARKSKDGGIAPVSYSTKLAHIARSEITAAANEAFVGVFFLIHQKMYQGALAAAVASDEHGVFPGSMVKYFRIDLSPDNRRILFKFDRCHDVPFVVKIVCFIISDSMEIAYANYHVEWAEICYNREVVFYKKEGVTIE